MQFILAVFVIQIPDYHQLGESCGVAEGGQGKLTTGARFVGPRDAKMRDQGVQAEKPLDTLGCRLIQRSTFTEG
jgi:hypothetical protein